MPKILRNEQGVQTDHTILKQDFCEPSFLQLVVLGTPRIMFQRYMYHSFFKEM